MSEPQNATTSRLIRRRRKNEQPKSTIFDTPPTPKAERDLPPLAVIIAALESDDDPRNTGESIL